MECRLLIAVLVCVFGSFLCFLRGVDAHCAEIGEFGDGRCQYLCRCVTWNLCDTSRGQCEAPGCAAGYGGTACQYENLAFGQAVETNVSIVDPANGWGHLVDGDSTTSVVKNGHSGLPIVVTTREKSWTDFIQVVLFSANVSFDTTASADDILVEYITDNNYNAATPMSMMTTTTTTMTTLQPHLPRPEDSLVTYRLPKPALVTGVRIRALHNKALALSEVSVFGGRNLALYKSATQGEATHINKNDNKPASASLAVDGETECTKRGQYSRTASVVSGLAPQDSWWTVFLGVHVNIWAVKIYHEDTANPDQNLFPLALNVTPLRNDSSSQVTVLRLNGSSSSPSSSSSVTRAGHVTHVLLPRPVTASSLTLWREQPGTVLQLCEVEVFGDCEDGYYGWECGTPCGCADKGEVCDKLWGFCPQSRCRAGYKGDNCQQECETGTFGFNCSRTCSDTCARDACDHVTGRCTNGCVAGWGGEMCEEVCSPGTHGDNCSLTCSASCRDNACDHVTGVCTNGCLPGRLGEKCDQVCSPGTHGDNCSLTCSASCRDNACDHVTGECTNGCLPGRLGEKCDQECGKGLHGPNCSSQCSVRCVDGTCHPETGHCLTGCVAGFTGHLCDQKVPRKKDDEGDSGDGNGTAIGVVIAVIVIVIVIAAVIAFFVWRKYFRRHNRQADVTKDRRNDDIESVLMTPLYDRGGGDDVDASDGGVLMAAKGAEHGAGSEENREKEQGELPRTSQENRQPQSDTEPPRHEISSDEKKEETTATTTTIITITPPKPKPRTVTEVAAATRGSNSTGSAPSPRPRRTKPGFVSLFSRDASQDPPDSTSWGPEVEEEEEKTKTTTRTSPAAAEEERGESVSSPRQRRATVKPSLKIASFESLETMSLGSLSLPSTPPRSRRPTGDSRDSGDEAEEMTLIPLSELPAKVAQWLANPRHFSKERSMLQVGKQHEWDEATLPHNIMKNRYRDIFPYDHSRVKLKPPPDDPDDDYYNACYFDGYVREKEYIAAQGPMERTVRDFLRLVWDTGCQRVVMLTRTVEFGQFKCQQYWPEEGVLTSGDIIVHVQHASTFADYTTRHLSLEREGQKRCVAMFHYTAWPDNAAPASPWSLLLFRSKVRQKASAGEGPVIVHCSAGIGRTGTYLALDILLSHAQHKGEVDVFQCVRQLREQRVNMVQTLAQYVFIHEALRASVLSSHPVPAGEFNLDSLLQRKEDGMRQIDKEYEQLQMCLGPVKNGDTDEYTPPEIVGLPRDIHRVNIQSVSDSQRGPAYINAVFLSNCRLTQAYIQTHSPTDGEGAVHFLSTLVQHRVSCVVSLDTQQDATFQYCPDSDDSYLETDPYTVTLQSMREAQGITVRKMRVSFPAHLAIHTGDSGDADSQEVTHITCSAWAQSRSTPPSVSMMLDLVNHVTDHSDRPVVVHCRDGHTRSGLVIVAAAVVEQLRTEGHVAVNYVTAHMRVPRRENIISVEQYEFLYACVRQLLNTERGSDVIASATNEAADDNRNGTVDKT
ncbi:uncharacterized protein LOC143275381 [Babylonia areolata]|uniref:uncharacterized protein LOC143275381 n=1 Tax=Babylonia areolata TaxID=304850 RepID=UPI003FD55EB0